MTLYVALGLKINATKADIRAAYRRLAKTCHPDMFPGDSEAAARWAEINLAHEVLTNEEDRAHYDKTGNIPTQNKAHIEEVALAILSKVMMDVVFAPIDATKADVKNQATLHLQDRIKEFRNQLNVLEGAIERSQALRGRWTRNAAGGHNVMDSMVKRQVEEIKLSQAALRDQITAHERAIEIMGDHEFHFDRETRVVHYSSMRQYTNGFTSAR